MNWRRETVFAPIPFDDPKLVSEFDVESAICLCRYLLHHSLANPNLYQFQGVGGVIQASHYSRFIQQWHDLSFERLPAYFGIGKHEFVFDPDVLRDCLSQGRFFGDSGGGEALSSHCENERTDD